MSDTVFEVGKTYRTARGKTAYVRQHHGAELVNPILLWYGEHAQWATADGVLLNDQLLPGAIEDERSPKQFADAINERLDQADNEIGFLARHLGFSVADGQIVQLNGDPIRQSGASIKRVFKGGWVNVYLDAAGPWFNPRPWSTREEANKQADQRDRERRLACIQIPDIIEGEGL